MKKLSILTLAAAGLLLVGCSDKDVAEEQAVVAATGEGYVGFQIQLPSASGATRANDDLNNGEDDEFQVSKAQLVLFKGSYNPASDDVVAKANAAVYYKTYSFDGLYEADTQGANENPTTKVTSTAVAVAKIDKLTLGSGEKLFAYVVINPNGSGLTSAETNETYAHFSQRIIAASTIGGNVKGKITGTDGLLMTSSPISNIHGGDESPAEAKVTSAVVLDEQNVKDSKAEAKNAPAGCIYVERAAAKVTVQDNISSKKISMGGEEVSFTITGWQIINTEPEYYNVRQCEDAWLPYFSQYHNTGNTKYRFVTKFNFAPTLPAEHSTPYYYRTYFARDPYYDVNPAGRAAGKGLVKTVASTEDADWNALTDRAFIPENTFDVEHQTWQNTTMATLKVNFGSSFYTLSDDAKKYTQTGAESKIQSNVVAINEVHNWLNDCIDYLSAANSNATVTSNFTITISDNTDAGTKTYTANVTFSVAGVTGDKLITDLSDDLQGKWTNATTGIKAVAEAYQTVTYYKDGNAYYNVRIQHFGEAETPWASGYASALTGTETEYTVKHIYGWDGTDTGKKKASENYLGRYGVVRDNWYLLRIDEISKLGTATPTDISGKTTPDDEVNDEYYISAHVHILPWVLRTQSVKF